MHEVQRFAVLVIGPNVERPAGEKGGIEMRERALYFLPRHKRPANRFVQSALAVSAPRKRRPVPRDLAWLLRLAISKGMKDRRPASKQELQSPGKTYFATAMLTRGLLDHVPPLFGTNTFSQVANNYGGGGRSFKDTMHHLENAARKVADAHLHMP